MIGGIVIRETGPTPRIAKRQQARITREVLKETATFHQRKHIPKHFTVAGGREYNYTPRKGEGKTGKEFWKSYTGQKKKTKGHTRPLVYSGESETLAKIPDIRSGRRMARIVQHARGLNRRNPASSIRMNDEIRTISAGERRIDVAFAQRSLDKKYRELRASRIRKI